VPRAETDAATTALILGGDPIVGRTLALLLESAGRSARYVAPGYVERPGAFDDVGVLLLAPPWRSDDLEKILDIVANTPAAANIPILTIGAPDDGTDAASRPTDSVPWPCRTEELRRRINAALGTGRAADLL
jgi:hypothetical protein